ncbi:glutathione S-transferase theta-3-like isoform X1 [Sceloporus undulatus]|uniref:glutathione S-transferase theta-3-like isoform X1 n=1 Tax=Sceloporus undulatus TaxID=8520 RepID=UPI001C4A7F22|nr:glutathione S-transferase theta-3-like isoform X1 [Sceloporus undulatus]
MVLELYLDLLSQPCRAVFIFAKKNNIPFIIRSMEMLKGQLFSEEFNKVNILRKVPVLKDGDFILEESTAILLYLTRKYNTPSHWYPPDMKKRARVDEFLAWQHSNLRPCAAKILWLRVVIPLFLGQQIPSEKVQDALEELNISLQKLDEKFLQDRPFIIGSEISLADLVAITELMQVNTRTWDKLPELTKWPPCLTRIFSLFHSRWAPVGTSSTAAPSSSNGASVWRWRWARSSSWRPMRASLMRRSSRTSPSTHRSRPR